MARLDPDIEAAVKQVLAGVTDQTPDFKRRLRKMIENQANGNSSGDGDVVEILELLAVDVESEDD